MLVLPIPIPIPTLIVVVGCPLPLLGRRSWGCMITGCANAPSCHPLLELELGRLC